MPALKVSADTTRCMGAGLCAMHCAEVFAQDEDTALVIVLADEPEPRLQEAVELAVYSCPTQALRLDTT